MKRRRTLLIVGGIIVAFVVAVAVWPGEKEPEYKGRKFSEWSRIGYRSQLVQGRGSAGESEAQSAIQAIGTNSLPFLCRAVNYQPSRFRKVVNSVTSKGPLAIGSLFAYGGYFEDRAETRASVAVYFGFQALGPRAAPAVPELTRSISGTNRDICEQAMIALAFIGKEGIPPLLAALQNQGYPSRDNALCYLVDAYENARDLKGVLPILSQYCADKDPRVAILAVILFDRLGEAAVPALCELTSNTNPEVRASAMDLLLKYGNRREPTLSALMRGLQDADARVRGAATNALERIAPEVLGTNRVSGEH